MKADAMGVKADAMGGCQKVASHTSGFESSVTSPYRSIKGCDMSELAV